MYYIPGPDLDVCLLPLSSEDSLAWDVILECSSNASIVTFIATAPLPCSIKLGTSQTTTSPVQALMPGFYHQSSFKGVPKCYIP